ncbi:hypothetical protein VQ405_004479 [Escherichia coli]|nr:hypothetical protein [Escherichia coli]
MCWLAGGLFLLFGLAALEFFTRDGDELPDLLGCFDSDFFHLRQCIERRNQGIFSSSFCLAAGDLTAYSRNYKIRFSFPWL